MEEQRRRGGMRLLKRTITAVFAVGFAFSLFSTFSAFAAANLFQIQNAELTEISATAEGSITSFDETNIVSSVTFHKLNDSAKYTVTLKNTDSKDHIIESITNDNENPHVTYEHDSYTNTTVAAGANLDFIVTAKYTTAVTDTSARAQATNVKFIIKFTDIEEPEEIPIVPNTGANTNPNTGDAIQSNVTMLVVFSAGLIICAIVYIKNHKKSAKVLGVAITLVAATTIITSVKAATTEVNSFTLTTNYGFFDKNIIKNGDDEIIINHCTKLGDIAEITNPTKTGYTFTGWQNQNGTAITADTEICEDTELTPNFTANKYTVRFNRNGATGGEDMASQEFTYDQAGNLTKNTFKFPGRTYGGWDTETNGSGVHYDDEASVENLTAEDGAVIDLYAQWSINPYYIAYDKNGGEGEMAQTACEYDQDCTLRENAFTKNGYDFKGWKLGDTTYADKAVVRNLAEEGTVTLVAQWQVHEYTITYTGLTDAEAAALRAAGNLDTYTIETPSFTLHNPDDRFDTDGDKTQHFEGWRESTVSTEITLPQTNSLSNKTYEAIWSNVATPEYTITYDYKGGNVATANKTKFTKFDTFTLNEPTKTGYTFTGWTGTDVATETKPYTVPTGIRHNLEFTAHYRKNTYTINFDGNGSTDGSTASMNMNYDEAKNLTANGFSRTGYAFAGWKFNNTDYEDGEEVSNLTAEDGGAVTMVAQWTPNTFTVIFHPGSDEVSNQDAMEPQTVTYDVATTITPNTYNREHYKFMGWATNATSAANANNNSAVNNAKVYDDGADITNAISEDGGELHLYAIWLERTSKLKKGYDLWYENFRTNNDIVSFEEYKGNQDVMAIESKRVISLGNSNFPTYAWEETDGEGNKRTYWWSEAEHPEMNSDIRQMFDALPQIEKIDLSGFIFPSATVLTNVFRNDAKLTELAFPSEAPTIAVGTSMDGIFSGCSSLESLNAVKDWDVSNVIGMNSAFSGAKNLKSLEPIKDWNVSNVTSMSRMFAYSGIESVEPIKNWNVNKVESMSYMFAGSNVKLTSVDLSGWSTSGNLKSIDCMFEANNADFTLTINLSGWNTSNLKTALRAFGNSRLTELDLTGWSTESLSLEGADGRQMFGMYATNLETIYTDHDFTFREDTGDVFRHSTNLIGGAGSTQSDGRATYVYARIDDPCNGRPGYFTWKNAQYICFNANYEGADPATAGQYVTTARTDRLMANPFTRPGYRLVGWAESADGAKVYDNKGEIAITTSVKSPKQLYAVWEAETFTITFHENIDDVTGTMGTQTVTAGTQTPLNANEYSKDHWRFLGWTTAESENITGAGDITAVDYTDGANISNVTSDTDLYAKWLYRCRTFATDSWSDIVNNLETDSTYYDATDVCEKEIQMPDDNGDTQQYTLRLINTSTPEECATEGFSQTGCGTVIEFADMATLRRWNPTGTTAGGWKASELNGWLNSTFYNRMPEDLKSVIIPTYLIVSGNGQGQESPDITAADVNLNKIFLPTRKEFGVDASIDNAADRMRTWDFYTVAQHRASYVRNRQGGGSWPYASWDRSARNDRTNLSTANSMGTENRVATYPVFRIGNNN